MTEWETAPAVAETPEIKLFGKWSTDDVQINDISLQVSDVSHRSAFIKEARLESRLDIALLSWCARVLAEEITSLLIHWLQSVRDPANHQLRHISSLCR